MFKAFIDGEQALNLWLAAFIVTGIVAGVASGFFKARKIQPRGFKWKIFRNEAVIALVTLAISGKVIAAGTGWAKSHGWITFDSSPAAWWTILGEYALYFFLFDTYFYWLHRWMHKEPVYSWVHKLHHKSTSPNLLTTLSVNPLESIINGGFVPLFLAAFTVHDATMALILPTNIFMGLYVHSGYEFLPRWWNRTWATKWFISATFHDQHHRYFTGNFGGYTTIWDRLCGTMRKKYEMDFEAIKDRVAATRAIGGGTPGQAAPTGAELAD
ncbi:MULTISPECIES: sterol desaturase family protein [unclassified Novosphingobium]|uniref:sterol desaturase family protein n=1 Tax=unclassified Novosphingobium TaxID=2644732 RepID=UPI0013575D51|nr:MULTISPECIES: sterol desaturase family protein [unclassified Novosphingobium]